MRNYSCGICKFFEPLNEPLGFCKRYAPSPKVYVTKTFDDLNDSKIYETRWPRVFDNNWCGEFEAM